MPSAQAFLNSNTIRHECRCSKYADLISRVWYAHDHASFAVWVVLAVSSDHSNRHLQRYQSPPFYCPPEARRQVKIFSWVFFSKFCGFSCLPLRRLQGNLYVNETILIISDWSSRVRHTSAISHFDSHREKFRFKDLDMCHLHMKCILSLSTAARPNIVPHAGGKTVKSKIQYIFCAFSHFSLLRVLILCLTLGKKQWNQKFNTCFVPHAGEKTVNSKIQCMYFTRNFIRVLSIAAHPDTVPGSLLDLWFLCSIFPVNLRHTICVRHGVVMLCVDNARMRILCKQCIFLSPKKIFSSMWGT